MKIVKKITDENNNSVKIKYDSTLIDKARAQGLDFEKEITDAVIKELRRK